MRKSILSIGVILIFAGTIIFSFSCLRIENSIPEGPLYKRSKSWEVSGEYKAGWKLLVYFDPPKLDLYPDYVANITVEVLHKKTGRKNIFCVVFEKMLDNPIPPKFKLLYDGGALKVENSLGEIGGVALHDGEYVANITRRGPWGPPGKIELWTEKVEVSYPYLIYLPIGLVLIATGTIVTFSGYKSRGRRYRRFRKVIKAKFFFF